MPQGHVTGTDDRPLTDDMVRATLEGTRRLLSRAVAAELGAESARPAGARVKLPLFGRPGTKRTSPSNADLEAALAADDGARVTVEVLR